MSGHQSTADGVNAELDQLQQMANPSVDTLMADIIWVIYHISDMNPNPDFSGAPDIHATFENNTRSNTTTANTNTANTSNASNTTSSDNEGHDNTAL